MISENSLILFLAFVLIITLFSCQKEREIKVFDIDGKSKLVLQNQLGSTIKVKIENWYQIPWQSQTFDTNIESGKSLELSLVIQGFSYYKIEIEGKEMNLFSKPNSVDSIIINKGGANFLGDLKKINEFLFEKSKDFQNVNAEWMPRANLTHGNTTTTELLFGNDTITQTHLDYLDSNKEKLPKWYVMFEKKRLQYLNFGWKVRSVSYRRAFLNKKDSLPPTFLEKSLEDIAVEDITYLGNESYMLFLSSYLSLVSDSFYTRRIPKLRKGYIDLHENRFKIIQNELHGKVKDVYLTYDLAQIINSQKYIFKESWLSMVKENGLRARLKEYFISEPILPQGAKMPFFSLLDPNNIRYESSQFDDQILLINFWASWCKPCIQEFPHENALAKQFEQEPVTIINICIESDPKHWKSMLDKFDLKTLNLIATKNWDEKLSKDFGIMGLPHSTLADWNGRIVQNRCPRASEGVDKLIYELLAEKSGSR